MSAVVKSRIVQIGNSKGIRIPKPLLEESGLEGEVELEVQPNQIVIRGVRHPREGWEKQFRLMAERGDDKLEDWDVQGLDSWDEDEWEW